jgi:protein-S-isoprenylcysteine O-methyltransferase Ste14
MALFWGTAPIQNADRRERLFKRKDDVIWEGDSLMRKDRLAATLFVLSSLVAIGVAFWTRSSLPLSRRVGKPVGEVVFLLGMAVFVWAVVHLKGSFYGTVTPVTDELIKSGPYRWVRHPLYLGMIITLLGIGIALRSLWGVVGIFALFLPTVVYRARLEEEALAQKFKPDWDDYAERTSFLIPRYW